MWTEQLATEADSFAIQGLIESGVGQVAASSTDASGGSNHDACQGDSRSECALQRGWRRILEVSEWSGAGRSAANGFGGSCFHCAWATLTNSLLKVTLLTHPAGSSYVPT